MSLIKIQLELTAAQLVKVAAILNADTPQPAATVDVSAPVVDISDMTVDQPAATIEQITQAEVNAGNLPPAAEAFAAATVETPPAITAANTVLDSKGLPWDARIHGKAKVTNADGSWRFKQGIDRVIYVPQIEAELRGALAAVPKPAEAAAEAQAVVQQDAPINTAVDAAPAVNTTPPPPPAGPTTFVELLPLITAAKTAGTITDEKLAQVTAKLGLAQFGLIATRPDLIPEAAKLLGV